MPPKKAAAAKSDAGEDGDKAFRWSAENERKLLLLTHPFATASTPDVERLLEQFPGTNMNGIKIRYSRLRVEKAKLREELGLSTTIGTTEDNPKATPTKGDKDKTPKGKKRTAKDTENVDGYVMKKGKKTKMANAALAKEVTEELENHLRDIKAKAEDVEI